MRPFRPPYTKRYRLQLYVTADQRERIFAHQKANGFPTVNDAILDMVFKDQPTTKGLEFEIYQPPFNPLDDPPPTQIKLPDDFFGDIE